MQYTIHNTTRDAGKRLLRAAAPTHVRHVQFLFASSTRVLPGRPLVVSEEKLREHFSEIEGKQRQGLIEVRTLDGRRVDLSTLTPLPGVPASPLPHPLLDSAANDRPHGGEKMVLFPGGTSLGDTLRPSGFEDGGGASEGVGDSEEDELDYVEPVPKKRR